MCGIAGIITPSETIARQAIPRMLGAQRHRGPDDAGEHYARFGSTWLGLGHRRLSILDLSPSGHQPMGNAASGSQIILNGEIYNFARLRQELAGRGVRFRSTGDTEVLLQLLEHDGPESIRCLEGMFAFAYLDASRQRLVLARDSIGIKPLYVAPIPGGLVFSSEVKAILATGLVARDLDQVGLAGLLGYGALQHPRTLVAGVRSFPAGCFQVIKAQDREPGAAPTAYWRFPAEAKGVTVEGAVEQVRATVEAAVKDHLVSDVPVGMFLSSGIDSTLVAGVAAKHAPDFRTFTVGFADHADMSEEKLAEATAGAFGLRHTTIQVQSHQAQAATLEWLSSMDQPSLDGLNTFVISKVVRQQGITVALSGQGGDELFGGYSTFREVPRLSAWLKTIGWLPRGLRRLAAIPLGWGRSETAREKLVDILGSGGSVAELDLLRRRVMSDGQLERLGIDTRGLGLLADLQPPEVSSHVEGGPRDPVSVISELETRFYLGNMLLRDGDVNSMAHSLEVRVPLLDQRLLDLALSLPGDVRLPKGAPSKFLLRQAFPEHLRPEIQQQEKRGFTLPIQRWLAGPMREMAEADLKELEGAGILRPEGIREIWRGFLAEPESSMWSRALTLVVLARAVRRLRAAGGGKGAM